MEKLGEFIPRADREREFSETANHYNNLVYLKTFGDDLDDEKLYEVFSAFGRITNHRVLYSGEGKSKGFGCVIFEEPEAARLACEDLNGKEMNNRRIHVGRAQERGERQAQLKKFEMMIERMLGNRPVNLYIKNLDNTINDERLREEFSNFGTITSAKVITEDGRSMGSGFVSFSAPEEATRAVTEMNGRILVSKPLYVTLAQSREDRKAHVASQYMRRVAGIRMQQMGQMFQPGGTSYLMPTMPQVQRFYTPQMAAQVKATPLWPAQPAAQVRAGATASFLMQAAPFRSTPRQTQPPRNVLPMATVAAAAQQQQILNLLQAARPVCAAGVPSSAALSTAARASDKYTNNMCNLPAVSDGGPAAAAAVAPVALPAVHIQDQEPLTSTMLSAALPQKQKQILGERLFPLIREICPELPIKITDMLLEMNNSFLLHMLADRNLLKAKVEEAVAALQPLTPSMLAAASPQEQKQMLGDRLFILIHESYPKLAGKITGMLLEIENSYLLHMLKDHNSLNEKVEEAVAALRAHHVNQRRLWVWQ